MIIYKVVSKNLIVLSEGTIPVLYHTNKDRAYQLALESVISRTPRLMQEDPKGELTDFDGESLNYQGVIGSPAVYYRSQHGNYPCVLYVQDVDVRED